MKRVRQIIPVVFLLAIFFRDTTGDFQLQMRPLLLLYLVFGTIGFAGYIYFRDDLSASIALGMLAVYLFLGVSLVWFLLVQAQGIENPGRGSKLALFLVLFMLFLGIGAHIRTFIKTTSVYLLAFSIFFGIFILHAKELHPGSGLATFPLIAGITMGLNLFVMPRYLSRDAFLWLVTGLSTSSVLLGLIAYLLDPYRLLSIEVGLRNSVMTIPLFGSQLYVLESVFANPNTLGVLTFAGTFAALVLTRKVYRTSPIRGTWLLPGLLVGINSIGLFLSYSRAGYLALAVAAGIYLVDVYLGRAALPYAILFFVGTVGVLLLGMWLGLLGLNPAGRFTLWGAGIRAILDSPSLIGAGIIDPSASIAPYIDGQLSGQSPHNSYLSIFIRAGILGGIAYLILTVGSIFQGVFRKSEVDVAMLSFAVGFALHQLFEAYTLFQFSLAAVLASLVFGYLIESQAHTSVLRRRSSDTQLRL
ncbi:O-antigen ligase like membrane protein [Halogranum amylolyticum]|uniref:O-antigen ligase like membrane protein n=1 Tax=Halogranum amylolyticum TaxID=660520 RepID=A0A1H8WPE4_9EURY|nr:O-antigen ligase family protein [Halogranum amylolyticum]SEP29373.1 O-antigen ligase like membrane protein [Halogranum amylolyticum]